MEVPQEGRYVCKLNGQLVISEHRWNTCVTREDKEFRFKAKGSK